MAPRLAELILVRHGQSEGNVARARSVSGDHSYYSGEFMRRHSSLWRLTDKGQQQARVAGEWIRNNCINDGKQFERYYTSEYLRAMETAALLSIPNSVWYGDMCLRERDWGMMDLLSQEERYLRFQTELSNRELCRFVWSPPGGESLADVCQRVDQFLNMLHRECGNKRVVLVCHGELMWAFRTRLERLSQSEYNRMSDVKGSVMDHIHHCHILHYSRVNPEDPSNLMPYFAWMRSVCPWDLNRSPNVWTKIKRKVYSSEDLLAEVNLTKRLIPEDVHAPATPAQTPEAASVVKPGVSAKVPDPGLLLQGAEGRDDEICPEKRLQLHKVLVVSKLTRLEIEKRTQEFSVFGDELRQNLLRRGLPAESIYAAHDSHHRSLDHMLESLKQNGIEADVVASETMEIGGSIPDGGYDLVFAAGGDGTFLKVASNVRSPNLPVVGINTDPKRSLGKLCSFAVVQEDDTANFQPLLDAMRQGNFNWRFRRRIKVTVEAPDQAGDKSLQVLSHLALNEVFMADLNPARPCTCGLQIDDGPVEVQRSSGVIVCTGSGSTAWMSNAVRMHPDALATIFNQVGVKPHTLPRFLGMSETETLRSIGASLDREVAFDPDSQFLKYLVREQVPPRIGEVLTRRHGWAKRIKITAKAFDQLMTLDGMGSHKVKYGTTVTLSLEEKDCLKNLYLS